MSTQTIRIFPVRAVMWIGFFTMIFLAWGLMFYMPRGNWVLCGPSTSWRLPLSGFSAPFPMWEVMMAATMLPTIVSTLRTYDQLSGA